MAGVAFPIVARYFIRFRHSDTGIVPVFTFFKKTSDYSDLGQPAISEVGGGVYAFDYTWVSSIDSDVVFEVDGGASIPTEEIRYVSDVISVRDYIVSSSGGGGGGGGAPSVG